MNTPSSIQAATPARGLALAMLAHGQAQQDRAQQDRAYETQKIEERWARLLQRDLRFGRKREDQLAVEDRDRLRRLRDGQLSVRRPDRRAGSVDKLARRLAIDPADL